MNNFKLWVRESFPVYPGMAEVFWMTIVAAVLFSICFIIFGFMLSLVPGFCK